MDTYFDSFGHALFAPRAPCSQKKMNSICE